MKNSFNENRRVFFRRAAALGATLGAAAPLATQLSALAALAHSDAQAQAAPEDYKALVCVFLFGANDHYNTLLPYDNASYAPYLSVRGLPDAGGNGIALDRATLLPIVPKTSQGSGREFALNPAMPKLRDLFNQERMAVMANVGPLIVPTSAAQYANQSVPLPSKLFSHNDQQSVWQASAAEGATLGWGGRMGDILASSNADRLFTCINANANSVWLAGRNVVQYQVNTGTSISTQIEGISGSTLFGSSSSPATLRSLISSSSAGVFAADYADITKRSIDANVKVQSALAATPGLTTSFDTTNSLALQLRSVARLISARRSLGAKRQVFFVGLGGFDLHDNLLSRHGPLLTQVDNAIAAFYAATLEMGIADRVTTFTASDFGRTLSSNGDGSDHGWGSHHFVVGGAVKGKDIYGQMPVVALGTTTDVGGGRLLPSVAVDQYGATLASWLGVSAQSLRDVFPNIGNFGSANLGFVS